MLIYQTERSFSLNKGKLIPQHLERYHLPMIVGFHRLAVSLLFICVISSQVYARIAVDKCKDSLKSQINEELLSKLGVVKEPVDTFKRFLSVLLGSHYVPLTAQQKVVLKSKLENNDDLYLIDPGQGPNESVLILKDSFLDPSLWNWLIAAQEIAHGYSFEKASQLLAQYTRDTFSKEGKWAEMQYHHMTRRPIVGRNSATVKLGDLIKSGTGVCLHNAQALSLALQQLGYSAKVIKGRVEIEIPGKVNQNEGHAWVEVIDQTQNKVFLLDPATYVMSPVEINPRPAIVSNSEQLSNVVRTVDANGIEIVRTYTSTMGTSWAESLSSMGGPDLRALTIEDLSLIP